MTVKSFVIWRMFLGLLLLELAAAGTLNCRDWDADKCKNEFSELLDKESKAMHATYSINMLEKYVEAYNGILSELPDNDLHREPIQKKLTEFDSKIQSFKKGEENVDYTVALMSMSDKLEPDFGGINFDDDSILRYKTLEEKYSKKVLKATNEELQKMYTRICTTWFELYAGLREKDLKTYREYAELNIMYQGLQASEDAWKSMIYWGVVENSTAFLKLSYYQKILDEVRKSFKH